jgi:hypothetical protein
MPDQPSARRTYWVGFLDFLDISPVLFSRGLPIPPSVEEIKARQAQERAAADPALVARVERAEKKLGITVHNFSLVDWETRAAVVNHLLDPADPRFHTDEVRGGLTSYTRTRGYNYDGWPHPTSAIYQNPLRRRPYLLVDNIKRIPATAGGKIGGFGVAAIGLTATAGVLGIASDAFAKAGEITAAVGDSGVAPEVNRTIARGFDRTANGLRAANAELSGVAGLFGFKEPEDGTIIRTVADWVFERGQRVAGVDTGRSRRPPAPKDPSKPVVPQSF